MNPTEVKEMVRNWYGGVAAARTGCCGTDVLQRDSSKTWAPGRGIENYAAPATIEGRKPASAPF
jgi:hypothetical protein